MSSPAAAPSSDLVVDQSPLVEQRGMVRLFDQMGIQPQQLQVIQKGITTYFSPKENVGWYENARRDIRALAKMGNMHAETSERLQEVGARIQQVTGDLEQVGGQIEKVHQQRKKEQEAFKQKDGALETRQLEALELLAEERSGCTHPFASRMGRMFSYLGGWVAPISVPVLSYVHRELIQKNCGELFTYSLSNTAKCVSTVFSPVVYGSVALVAGIACLASYGKKVVAGIEKIERRVERVKDERRQENERLQKSLEVLSHQDEEFESQRRATESALKQSHHEQNELDHKRSQLHSGIESLRNARLQGIIERDIGGLEDTLAQNQSSQFVQRTGSRFVQNLLDAVITSFAGMRTELAIQGAGSSPQLAIEDAEAKN